jgi:hypothetical protein
MISTSLQVLLSLITAIMAYVELKKEFRKRSTIERREAKLLLGGLIIVAIITIGLSIFTYFDNKAQQEILQVRFNGIDSKNTELEKQITKDNQTLKKDIDTNALKVISTTADKALQASKELRKTAYDIEADITGTVVPPYIVVTPDVKRLSLYLIDQNKLPAYISVIVVNYSEIEKCTFYDNNKIIDDACFESNKASYSNLTLKPFVSNIMPVPHGPLKSNISVYKLAATLYIGKSEFQYEIYFTYNVLNNYEQTDVRILKRTGKSFNIYSTKLAKRKIDWDTEFKYLNNPNISLG